MDKKYIENSILTILKRELRFKNRYKLGSFNFSRFLHGKITKYNLVDKLDTQPLFITDPTKEKIYSENYETLLTLYFKSISEGISKNDFLQIFTKALAKIQNSEFTNLLYFYLVFLFKIRNLSYFISITDALSSKRFITTSKVLKILIMVSQIIRYEYESISEKDIASFKEILSTKKEKWLTTGPLDLSMFEHKEQSSLIKISSIIDKQITEVEFRSLKLKLADINPVINEDKQRSLKILGELGFDPKFSDGLNAIEDYFRKGELDKQEAATCISKIGSFILDFNLELIRRIEKITGEKFGGNKNDVASTIQYLKKNNVDFFDHKEAQLYKSVYDLCSDTGRHHLVSEKEHARISKNILIELILLALQKLRKYSSK